MNSVDIFIGSSKEGLIYAEIIKKELQEIGNCTIWNTNFFEINTSTFDHLCKKAINFDFAILVGTADDPINIRGVEHHSIRDNILFECGLFTGSIGRQRTFVVFQKGSHIPSDFHGITLPFFSNNQELIDNCRMISEKILEEISISRITMLPSTASAISYFYNFIEPVSISIDNNCCIDDSNISKCFIIMPETLKSDFKPYIRKFYKNYNCITREINTPHRQLTVFSISKNNEDIILDIPACLNASYKSIELFIGKDYIGETKNERFLIKKELSNFRNVLQHLVNRNDYACDFFKILSRTEYEKWYLEG